MLLAPATPGESRSYTALRDMIDRRPTPSEISDFIAEIETGRKQGSVAFLRALADAHRVTLDELTD
tara:strand:- start:15031 stop:15228 length:198 start_codon:yes stop_codon:yes gene_type:complete